MGCACHSSVNCQVTQVTMAVLTDDCPSTRLPSTAALLATLWFVSRAQSKEGQQCASDGSGCSCCAPFVNSPQALQRALDLHSLHGIGHVRVL